MEKTPQSQNISKAKRSWPQTPTKLSDEQLAALIDRLNQICRELDPYQKLSTDLALELSQLGLTQLDDPFAITNQLVAKLEDAIDEKMLRERNASNPKSDLKQ